MKIVLRYDRKKRDLDYILWPESRPIPPIIGPPDPEEAKDMPRGLTKPRRNNKKRRSL